MERKKRFEVSIQFPTLDGFVFISCNEFPEILPLIKQILRNFLREHSFNRLYSFHVIYTTDKQISSLNKTYKNKVCPTDVLSFPYKEEDYMGDIVISLETVALQAKEFSCIFSEELCRVTIHGILHLLGFIDTIPVEKRKMWKEQERLVQICFPKILKSVKRISLL